VTILFLCHRVPYPPNKGEKIRAYHQIAHLGRRHRVHLACLADTRADLDHARSLEGLCASVDVVYRSHRRARLLALAALPTGRSLSVAAFDSPELRRRVERRAGEERMDVHLAHSVAMAQYVDHDRETPRLLDFVDADSEKWRSYGRTLPFPSSTVYGLEAERLAAYEARMALEFDASIFVSEAEAEIVRRRAPGRDLSVIPNGVDLVAFRPGPDDLTPPPRIVFTGQMGYYPNVDAVVHFAQDVFPLIRRRVPDAEFRIVGRDPSAPVRRLARLAGVVVTGAVDDVRPHLADAAVAVAPFRISRGVPNKVLEAMACGLPVVGTPVAFQALGSTEADGALVAGSNDAFAEEVARLLQDPARRRALGRAARLYVETHHVWERSGALLESKLLELVRARGECAPGEVAP
jgi:sugar transferase (PEP-CTERM/EpsH1 system associated)